MNMSLWTDGGLITLMGMGTVFFFLVILIWAIDITEKIMKYLNKYFPEETKESITPKKKIDTKDEEIAVAIATVLRNTQKV